MINSKALLMAGGIALAGAGGAAAATLDFTDNSAYEVQTGAVASGSLGGGVTWTLTPNKGQMTFTDFDGDEDNNALAFENDGVGIFSDADTNNERDEVTFESGEELLLTFSRSIRLTGVRVLDLFFDEATENEEAIAFNAETGDTLVTLVASDQLGTDGGYAFKATNAAVRSIRFLAGGTSDDTDRDFALAAIDFAADADGNPAPIPLPAGGLLLMGALGGLGLARRRKKA